MRQARAWGQRCLVIAVAGSALGIGAVDTRVLSVVVLVLAIATVLLWWRAEPLGLGRRARLLGYVAAGLTAFTALQCVPLPSTLLAHAAPHNFEVWSRALAPLREPTPSWLPLTLDPVASSIQLLRSVGYLLCYLAALQVVRTREGIRLLELAIVLTGLAVAVVAIVNPIVSPEKVYGLYRPRTDVTIVASFLNINNLAAYTTISLLLAANSALGSRPLLARPILIAIATFLFSTILWFGSRGGTAAALFGLAMIFAIAVLINRRRRDMRFQLLVPLGALLGIVATVLAVAPRASHLATKDLSKLGVAMEALRTMVPAYPLFGAGRGAFESTFPEYRQLGGGFVVYTHPENIFVQWATEWGAPVALVALTLIIIALRPRHLPRRAHVIGAWCALVAIFLHDQVDFSSEIPGVVFALVVCAAVVVGGPKLSGADAPRVISRMPFVAAAAAVPLICLAIARRPHELIAERQATHGAAVSSMSQRDFRKHLRAALIHHPAEPYFPYLGAARSASSDAVVSWVGRCIERARIYPPIHLLFARSLRRGHRDAQARLEYRLSAEEDGAVDSALADEILTISTTFDDVLEAVPRGPLAVPLLEVMAQDLTATRPALRTQIDREILSRAPSSFNARLRVAKDAAEDLEDGESSPWCSVEGVACARRALDLAACVERLSPDSHDGYALEAQVHVYLRDPHALDRLKAACDVISERAKCLKQLALLAQNTHRDAMASDALSALGRVPCVSDDECVRNWLFSASLEETRGNNHEALHFYEKAAEHEGAADDVVLLLATRARALGRHDIAIKAYSELSRRHPNDDSYQGALAQERAAMAGRHL